MLDHLVGQFIELLGQLLLLLRGVHALDRRAQRHELVLGLLPLALIDQLPHLHHLGLRGQHHLVVARGLRTEERRPHSVQGVTRAGSVHRRPESADAQHRGGSRCDEGQPRAAVPMAEPVVQGRYGIASGELHDRRRLPHVITPVGEQECEFGLGVVGRIRGVVGGERVEESIYPIDLVERRVSTVGGPTTEVRHRGSPFRRARP